MSNRYSKTAFTARENARLDKIRNELFRIVNLRMGKQDSPLALDLLFRAEAYVKMAQAEAGKWKNE